MAYPTERQWGFWCLIILVLFMGFASCSSPTGGSSSNSDSVDDGTDPSGGDDSPETPQLNPLAGYDLALEEGTWWKFYWKKESRTSWYSSYDSNSSSSESFGYLTITLGPSTTLGGVTFYSVQLSGDIPEGWSSSFWDYLGVDSGSLLGYLNGSGSHTIINGDTSQSERSFFLLYSEALNISSSSFTVSYPAAYSTTSHKAGYSSSYDDSIVIPGYDPIDGDEASLTISEHYKPGVGPMGIVYHDYLKDVTGPSSWDTIIRDWTINLVDTSLAPSDGFVFPQPAWEIHGEMPAAKSWANVVELDGSVYVIGGEQSYSPSTSAYRENSDGSWTQIPSIPLSWLASTSGSGAAVANSGGLSNDIYFVADFNIGGTKRTRIYRYSPTVNSWTLESDYQIVGTYSSYYSFITTYSSFNWGNDQIYSIGKDGRLLLYEISTSTFTDLGIIMNDFTYINSVADGSRVFLVGQYEPYYDAYQTGVQYYNGTSWIQIYSSHLSERRWHPALAIYNDRLYIFGGTSEGTEVVSAAIGSSSLSDWQEHSPMLYGGTKLSALVIGDKIYIYGTDDGKKIEVYTPANDS